MNTIMPSINISAPSEIYCHIFSLLPLKDLFSCFQVNKLWYELADSELVWAAVALRISKFGQRKPDETYKNLTKRLKFEKKRNEWIALHSLEPLQIVFKQVKEFLENLSDKHTARCLWQTHNCGSHVFLEIRFRPAGFASPAPRKSKVILENPLWAEALGISIKPKVVKLHQPKETFHSDIIQPKLSKEWGHEKLNNYHRKPFTQVQGITVARDTNYEYSFPVTSCHECFLPRRNTYQGVHVKIQSVGGRSIEIFLPYLRMTHPMFVSDLEFKITKIAYKHLAKKTIP